jgi:hypothetical protein
MPLLHKVKPEIRNMMHICPLERKKKEKKRKSELKRVAARPELAQHLANYITSLHLPASPGSVTTRTKAH